jgi:hypothetical protein
VSRRNALVAVIVLAALAVRAVPSPVGAQPAGTRSFHELGFGDRTARSTYGSLTYAFALPVGQRLLPDARLDLVFSHSPALVPDRSTMTVTLNGQSLAGTFLTDDNRERGHVEVPLPVDGISGERFTVRVAFHMRLTHDACEDAGNPALWATIHGESRLTLSTRTADDGPRLADLAGLLAPSGSGSSPEPLAIGLQFPGASPEELRAAGLVAFQYGRWAHAARRDPLIEAGSDVPPGASAGIVVGTGERLGDAGRAGALRWDGGAFVGDNGTLPREYGVLALTGAPPRLAVTGATPRAVLTAAEALVQPERRTLLDAGSAIVTGEAVAWNDAGRPWREGAASFAQLGAARQEVTGPGLHTLSFAFERPPGWILARGSTLDLMIESTPGVRRDTSWIAPRVNGIDLGSRPLAPASGEIGRYVFPLPAEQLNADLLGRPLRRLDLAVDLFLDVEGAGCLAASPDSARATLLPSSTWRLPHDQYRGLDLGRFPAMFFTGSGAPVTVVIPARSSAVELAAGLAVMAALGYWSGSEEAAWPRLVTDAALTDEERRGHLIVIGGPEQNAVSGAARSRDRTLFQDTPPPLYGPPAGGAPSWGTLQLDRSPWGPGHALLAISGSNAEGLRLAASALGQTATLSQVQGRTVFLAEGFAPQTTAAADPVEPPPPALAPRIARSFRERLQAWQVAGAVLLAGFVATVALVLTRRLRVR